MIRIAVFKNQIISIAKTDRIWTVKNSDTVQVTEYMLLLHHINMTLYLYCKS